MTEPSAAKRRRKPTQARARDTIATILRATAQVLIADGYDKASTNRIAKAAGVSVGSLYQYFPNKQAVVAALADAHVSATISVVERSLLANVGAPLERAIPLVIAALIESQQIDPELHRVMVKQAPVDALAVSKRRITEVLKVWMTARRDDLRVRDLDTAAFMVVEMMDGVICAAVLDHPGYLEDDRLRAELTDVVMRYLLP